MPINIQDDSGDKEFFTIIPNYIINHSTATDQALYLQMKRFAGESGKCFVSERKLMEKLGVGNVALKKSLEYLTKNGWISYVGLRDTFTGGGKQKIKTYKVNNIWKMNTSHYRKGASETIPPDEQGASETIQRGAVSEALGASETAIEEEHIIKKNIKKKIELTPAIKTQLFFENKNKIQDDMIIFLRENGVPDNVIIPEVKKFVSYWTEPNQSGTKVRWELQRTFDVKRRLTNWFSNMRNITSSTPKRKITI